MVDQAVDPASITAQPTDVSVRAGRDARFSLGVSGTPRPVVTWQFSDDDGATWHTAKTARIFGEVGTASWVVRRATRDLDGRLVRALVENAHGSVTSDAVRLAVTKPGRGHGHGTRRAS